MKIHNPRSRRDQRGVALLLALGSLSLMLVTGMAFLSSAIVARQAAANYRGRTQAKYIARSAMARLMLRLKYDLNNAADPWDDRLDRIVSRHITGDSSKMASESGLTDRIDDDERFMRSYVNGERKTVEALYGSSAADRPQWEFLYDLYDNDGKVEDDARIIGRIAYMAIPGTANVNLSEVLRGHPDAVAASHSETGWEKRRGVGIRELNFDIDRFSGSRNALKTLAQRFATGEDYSSDQSRDYSARDYQSFDELSTVLGKASVNALRKYMLTSGYNEPEAYVCDKSADRESPDYTDSADFYHRFWLNRKQADWNALTVDDLLAAPTEFDKGQLEQPKSNTIKALPYLCKLWWENDESGSSEADYKSPEARRRQVAANLIDYADSNNEPTSDSTNWWSSEPTYTGLEKTHYLNEVGVQFTTTVNASLISTETDLGGNVTRKFQLDASIYAGQILLETVNIYENAFPTQQISIEGTIDYDVTLADGSVSSGTFDFKQESRSYAPNQNGRYGSIIFEPAETGIAALPSVVVTNVNGTPNTKTMKVSLKKLTIKRMYLMDDSGKPVDYTRKLTQDFTTLGVLQNLSFNVPLSSGSIVDACAYAGFQVDDPRENLTQGRSDDDAKLNWKATYNETLFSDVSTGNLTAINGDGEYGLSISKVNNFFKTCKGKYGDQNDYEKNIGDDLDNISPAYISNEVMQSPLELGAIHRAAKWETINLKKAAENSAVYNYDPNEVDLTAKTGFTHADGDAAILDQVKMTERVFSPGKINMNYYAEDTGTPAGTAKNYLYQAAFVGIPWEITLLKDFVESLKSNAIPAVGKVSESAATEIRHHLAKDRGSSTDTFLGRGAMIGYPYSDSGTENRMANAFGQIPPANDIQAEAIPAMAAALFSASSTQPDTISFVLVAQAINDLGGGFKMAKARIDDADETVEHTMEYGKFDYEKVNDRYYYFDEILGEVKMLVTIRYERETRKVTLIQAEYID